MSNIESNELIARFMGLETQLNTGTGYTFPFPVTKGDFDSLFQVDCGHGDEMLYDSSWDWLMPVCDKIRSIGSIDFVISLKGSVCISFDDGTVYFDMVKGGGRNTIETTYEAVINFIHWYNNNHI